jgi:hypothetical protein
VGDVSPWRRAQARAADLRLPEDRFVIAKFDGAIPNEARAALASAGFREVGCPAYDACCSERPVAIKASRWRSRGDHRGYRGVGALHRRRSRFARALCQKHWPRDRAPIACR